jgi:hypothetical protein
MTVPELRKGKKHASTARRMNKERKLCNLENDFRLCFSYSPQPASSHTKVRAEKFTKNLFSVSDYEINLLIASHLLLCRRRERASMTKALAKFIAAGKLFSINIRAGLASSTPPFSAAVSGEASALIFFDYIFMAL